MHQPTARPLNLALTLVMALALVLTAGWATAKEPGSSKTHPRKASVKPAPKNGSGETTAERERRLYRECKGRRNAGACLGFAS